jgi:hypothetical protein
MCSTGRAHAQHKQTVPPNFCLQEGKHETGGDGILASQGAPFMSNLPFALHDMGSQVGFSSALGCKHRNPSSRLQSCKISSSGEDS